ncbi:NXPE family member 4-like isoform X2 [Ruditapes philippinarum]|uniref:NXPE family member 4-like isoform X2 n=1 Tax=Ruditapes philippinarum TaxID=129788 RepID=UPI00295AA024|nr:NXPE family member 4-like isoform X2 [Ruditapes philippinarum]
MEKNWIKLRVKTNKCLRTVSLVFFTIVIWITIETIFDFRLRLHDILPDNQIPYNDPLIEYEPCTMIPHAPKGTIWPEEEFRHDTEPDSILELADPLKSKAWIEGRTVAIVGDTVTVRVVLYNGYGQRKQQGGDLIRVWMKEPSLGASSTGHVIDNKNGSYSAILTAFWEGKPEIVIAIISPREVISTAFKRRYWCPPVLMNTAIFTHPVVTSVVEETPCNYVSQVPGYKELCNFTQENYGRPWFCGKPRHQRLMCQDWTMVADVNLWQRGEEKRLLSNIEYDLMTLNYTARKLDSKLILTVTTGKSNQSVLVPLAKCADVTKESSWETISPTGYFYRRRWTNKICRTTFNLTNKSSRATFNLTKTETCLRNTSLILIGDSTLRQIFSELESLVSCNWITDHWSTSGKHRPAICVNRSQNFSLTWELHPLPFCTRNTPRHYFKSFGAYLNELQSHSRTIIVLHMYAHVLNHHSSVFFETLKDMKKGIIGLLDRNKNAHVIIKGPNAYSFSKSTDHVIWMPDAYSRIYQAFIINEFKDVKDRVIYLDTMDMTVSSEQWHIHVENYVVQAYIEQILNRICTF